MKDRKKYTYATAAVLCVFGLLSFLAQQVYYYDQFIDDAYISFHYARNLAEGKGLSFNPGEQVEGYSNFLWVLALAAGIRLGGDAQVLAKILGGLFGVLSLGASFLLVVAAARGTRATGIPAIAAALAACLLGTNTYLAYWSSLGLETSLFTFALTLSCALAIWEVSTEAKIPFSAAVFIVVFLTRPEGIFYFFPLLAIRGWLWLKGWKPRTRDLIWLAVVASAFAAYAVWKIVAYGMFFPNTYYAKAPPPLFAQHFFGARYIGAWCTGASGTNTPVLLITLLFGGICLRGGMFFFVLPMAAVSLYSYWVDGDWMGNYRFLVPAMPFLYGLAAAGCWQGIVRLWCRKRAWGIATAVLLVILFAVHVTTLLSLRHDGGLSRANSLSFKEKGWFLHLKEYTQHGFIPPLAAIAEFFLAATHPGERIMFPDIGLVAYSTRCAVLDSRGLTDRAAANLIHATKRGRQSEAARVKFLEHFFATSPTLVAFVLGKESDRPGEVVDRTCFENPIFQSAYKKIRQLPYYGGTHVLVVYAKVNWQWPLDPEAALDRFRVLLRENQHVPHFYATFIRLLANANKKDELREYLEMYRKRFPGLTRERTQ